MLERADKAYTPIRQGGFRVENGTRYFNRPLFYKGSMLAAGDRPMFLILRGFGKQWAAKLRFAFSKGTRAEWLDEFPAVTTELWPGYASYVCEDPAWGVKVRLVAAPGLEGWSSIFKLEVTGPGAEGGHLHWIFGDVAAEFGHKDGMFWLPSREFSRDSSNQVSQISPHGYRMGIDPNDDRWKRSLAQLYLGSLEFYVGSDWTNQQLLRTDGESVSQAPRELHQNPEGNLVAGSAAMEPAWKGSVVVVWGGEPNRKALSNLAGDMERLNLPWGMALFREWQENLVGRGSNPKQTFEKIMAAPEQALADVQSFWKGIQQRVAFDLPDDELTAWANWLAASQEYLNWPLGQMDGLDVWGQAYLHIHNMYSGWDYLGAHDQQQKWLRLYATSVRNGWIGLYHGIAPWTGGLETAHAGEEDQIPHYANYVYTNYLWTGDQRFVRDVWPALKQLLDRELMQNDADGDGLFAARFAYWTPENDSYGPKTGLESGQMLRALRGAAEMAQMVGDVDAGRVYSAYAAKIEKALPQLWDSAAGVLGWRDPLDVLHISPSAPDLFLPILRGAVTPLQGYQMLRWERENLWSEIYPGTARIFLTANYGAKQNVGPVPDVALTTAAAAGLAGDMDHFFPALKTVAHSYFYNSWPGAEGAGITAWGSASATVNDHNDGRMPALYLLGRGLFGLEPDLPHHRISVEPRFPSQWKTASIHTPDIAYRFEKSAGTVQLEVSSPRPIAKTLRIPVNQDVVGASIDGKKADFHIEPSVNRAFAVVEVPAGTRNVVRVTTTGPALQPSYPPSQTLGVPFRVTVAGAESLEVVDPQRTLKNVSVSGNALEATPIRSGNRTAFVKASRGKTSLFLPLDLTVGETFAILNPNLDAATRRLSFELANPSAQTGNRQIRVKFRGEVHAAEVKLDAKGKVQVSIPLGQAAWGAVTPGSNPLEVAIDGRTYDHRFIDWKLAPPDSAEWQRRLLLLDLAWDYNEQAASLFNTKFYYDAWQMGIDYPVLPPATYEWAGIHLEDPKLPSFRFLAAGKIPFYLASEQKLGGVYQTAGVYQSAEGGGPRNVLAVANWRPGLYPSNVVIPLQGLKASKVYFLAYSWQRGRKAFHPNVELVANYSDGSCEVRQLIPPYSFMPRITIPYPLLYQHGFALANGGFYRPETLESDLPIGKENAEVYDLPIHPSRTLKSVEVRSVTTESIFAIFGITVVKAE
jgi:hypothetical protein